MESSAKGTKNHSLGLFFGRYCMHVKVEANKVDDLQMADPTKRPRRVAGSAMKNIATAPNSRRRAIGKTLQALA